MMLKMLMMLMMLKMMMREKEKACVDVRAGGTLGTVERLDHPGDMYWGNRPSIGATAGEDTGQPEEPACAAWLSALRIQSTRCPQTLHSLHWSQ
jgi:hypothetical protein